MVSVVEPSDVPTTLGFYGDACPAVGGVFPEDLEEAAEMLAEKS